MYPCMHVLSLTRLYLSVANKDSIHSILAMQRQCSNIAPLAQHYKKVYLSWERRLQLAI